MNKYLILTAMLLLAVIFLQVSAQPDKEWSTDEWKTIRSLSLQNLSTPSANGNQYANNAEAIAFGKKLFFDKRLSKSGNIACSSCHRPDNWFTDGQVIALGANIGKRNTPSLHGVAWNTWFFWDGRKDSLWSQALAPLENPVEHNLTRTDVLKTILKDTEYLNSYNAIFANTDTLPQGTIPPDAQPSGTIKQIKTWKALDEQQRLAINQMFTNIGKAIAAYVTTITPVQTRFDEYVRAVESSKSSESILNEQEKAGLRLFINPKTQCINCHFGPLLTNQSFHNIGTARPGLDSGRAAIIDQLRFDPFNCLGNFSDKEVADCRELQYLNRDRHANWGSYKTPTLRNISNTAPYFHDGSRETLADVIQHYTQLKSGEAHMEPIQLTLTEQQQLLAFLKTLAAVPDDQ